VKEALTNKVSATVAPVAEQAASNDYSALLENAYTWITLSFVIFVAIFLRFVWPAIAKGLDGRSETIRLQLEQATRLRNEAQALLATYQEQQHALLKDAEEIIANAKKMLLKCVRTPRLS